MTECTGIAASWCPVHGDCTCPRNEDGEVLWNFVPGVVSVYGFPAWSETAKMVTHWNPWCRLHGDASTHPEAA